MRTLPLYPTRPSAPVDSGAVSLDRSCARCAWSAGAGRSCLPADGEPGGLLVVANSPVKGAQRPYMSASGMFIRDLVKRNWDGPVVFDYAVKCPAPGKVKMQDARKPINECRGHLATVLDQARPRRILALGTWAAAALVGRSLDAESARRGYGWVKGDVPVFFLTEPMAALENKFIRRRFERDFREACTRPTPRPVHYDGQVHVIHTAEDAEWAEECLSDHEEVLFDVETAGIPHGKDFTVLCAGVAPVDSAELDAWVWSGEALQNCMAVAALKRVLASREVSGSNLKYDMIAAKQCLGIEVARPSFDTQVVRKLAEPTSMGRLDYASELVGMGGHKEEAKEALARAVRHARLKKERPTEAPHSHWCSQAIRAGTPGGTPMNYAYGLIDKDLLHRYNGRDVVASARSTIHIRARTQREAPRELAVWGALHRPALKSFARIESVGFKADRQAFETFSAHLEMGLRELREAFKAYGPEFNPNTPKQVARILFDVLKLPKGDVSEKTGDPSTDKTVLEALRGAHPFVDHMIEWRRLEKMDGTYARGMIEHIQGDGRIHPTFRLDGTETVRLSSENPNGQNLPRAETVEGKMCRDGFVASPGHVLIELDQSQIELRVAAGMSGDPDMIQIFVDGKDYHMRTAQLISRVMWNLAEDAVGEFHRQYCKTVNFGLLYGKTDAGLAEQLGCDLATAAKIRQAILGRFKKLSELIKHLLYMVRRDGQVEIPWFDDAVHVRPLLEAGGHDKWKRMNAENAAVNSPIQGRAAMYTLASIPLIHDWIDREGAACEIVNTVHDSIIFDVHPDWADRTIAEASRIMTSWDCWGVPLVVDAKGGDRWGTLRKIKHGETYSAAQVRWAAEALKKDA